MNTYSLFAIMAIFLLAGSCKQADQVAEINKAMVIQANDELFNQGNVDFVDEVFAADYQGTGPEMIKGFVKELRAAFPDIQVTIDPVIGEGNMTAWRRTHAGTFQGAIRGFQPTGKKITWEDFVITRYENGKIAQEWGNSNLTEVLRAESQTAHNAEEVIAAAKGAVDALNNKDAEAYVGYLHPDFSRFLSQNAELLTRNDPKAMQEDFQKGMDFNMQLNDLEVAFYDNTAIVTGFEDGPHRLPDGRMIDGKRKYTSVWVNENGEWKVVHLHISKVE